MDNERELAAMRYVIRFAQASGYRASVKALSLMTIGQAAMIRDMASR